ncbi:MAG: RNA 2'-phosphotransferase [Demequinaceae bacterium]|nr:RNA 2'-phosphotransferase [Demequinaceae bacterium]
MRPGFRDVELSRMLSHALRHEPWVYELELDEDGWVDVTQVTKAVQEQSPRWVGVTPEDIARVVATAGKQRHEIRGDCIRALYGHSVAGLAPRDPVQPPMVLYHGTTEAAWPLISEQGLLPMDRRYVHLSVDVETASKVGQRKGLDPVVLKVDAVGAWEAGVPFYAGNAMVWLADAVPSAFLARV